MIVILFFFEVRDAKRWKIGVIENLDPLDLTSSFEPTKV